ncbi:MAG: TatD family deoxyribonuclease [Gammaproteobacteria bacterium]|nr:TatD family deoxyribonuclease [Gammaproteobacteria bacterium]
MINTHAHLDFDEVKNFDFSTEETIVPSIGKENWRKVTLFDFFALGIHPWYVDQHSDLDLDLLEIQIKKNKPIAVGECGLDFSLNHKSNHLKQVYFFKHQLHLAQKNNLPVIIHSVKANHEVISHLSERDNCGVIHGFYGSPEEANKFTSMGFFLGIGHAILKQNYRKMESIIQICPMDKILIETDDGNPDDLTKIASKISSIKGLSYDETVLNCDNNAKKLFGI